jgi:hypothetical protein
MRFRVNWNKFWRVLPLALVTWMIVFSCCSCGVISEVLALMPEINAGFAGLLAVLTAFGVSTNVLSTVQTAEIDANNEIALIEQWANEYNSTKNGTLLGSISAALQTTSGLMTKLLGSLGLTGTIWTRVEAIGTAVIYAIMGVVSAIPTPQAASLLATKSPEDIRSLSEHATTHIKAVRAKYHADLAAALVATGDEKVDAALAAFPKIG